MLQLDPKESTDRLTLALEWAGKLPSGVTVQSCTASAIRTDTGADVTGTLLTTPNLTVSGTQVLFTVLAGVHGIRYKLAFAHAFSNGDTKTIKAIIDVVDE